MPSETIPLEPLESLARVRELLAHIDQIDRQTGAMMTTLSDAATISGEARARATHDLAELITRLEEEVARRDREQIRRLSSLAEELATANTELRILRSAMDDLESRLTQAVATFAEEPQHHNAGDEPAPTPVSVRSREIQQSLIIKSVPNAVTGLAIQRWLESIPGVLTITARSFSNGELHFEVRRQDTATGNFDLERLSEASIVSTATRDGSLRYSLVAPEWFVHRS